MDAGSGAARIAMLQQVPLFGGIRDDVLAFLLGRCHDAEIPRGAYFYREGEPGDSMFVLESGRVEVRKKAGSGELVLATLGAGDCIGEMALIELAPRSASVQALDDCRGFEIAAAALYALYERDLEQFALIQMNLARELSRRLRGSHSREIALLALGDSGDGDARAGAPTGRGGTRAGTPPGPCARAIRRR